MTNITRHPNVTLNNGVELPALMDRTRLTTR